MAKTKNELDEVAKAEATVLEAEKKNAAKAEKKNAAEAETKEKKAAEKEKKAIANARKKAKKAASEMAKTLAKRAAMRAKLAKLTLNAKKVKTAELNAMEHTELAATVP